MVFSMCDEMGGEWEGEHTLDDLLSSVNLGDLFLEQLVTLLADGDNLLVGHT